VTSQLTGYMELQKLAGTVCIYGIYDILSDNLELA